MLKCAGGYSRRMGKLAERYADAGRSGVYRVSDARIPLAAAREADAFVLHLDECAAIDAPQRVRDAMSTAGTGRCRVLLVTRAAEMARDPAPGWSALLACLQLAAIEGRNKGNPVFAVLVDPDRRLDLPNLYKEA